MDRNLIIRNISPLMPTRSWRKNTGPLLVTLTAMATASSTGDSSRTSSTLVTASKVFFSSRFAPR